MSFDGSMLRVPLSSLLGIRPGMLVAVHAPPPGFLECLMPLPQGAALLDAAKLGIDCAVLFARKKTELVERLPVIIRGLSATGSIWVAFPHAGLDPQGPNEDFVRVAALELGMRDVKKLVLDPSWSALRVVARLAPPRAEKPEARA